MWIDWIKHKLDAIDSSQIGEPDDLRELTPECIVVDVVPDDLKKLYVLGNGLLKAENIQRSSLNDLMNGSQNHSSEDEEKLRISITRYYFMRSAVQEIFWVSLKEDLNLWGNPKIGVRKEWKVVTAEPNEDNLLPIMVIPFDDLANYIISEMKN